MIDLNSEWLTEAVSHMNSTYLIWSYLIDLDSVWFHVIWTSAHFISWTVCEQKWNQKINLQAVISSACSGGHVSSTNFGSNGKICFFLQMLMLLCLFFWLDMPWCCIVSPSTSPTPNLSTHIVPVTHFIYRKLPEHVHYLCDLHSDFP